MSARAPAATPRRRRPATAARRASRNPEIISALRDLSAAIEAVSGELALTPLLTRLIAAACRLTQADDGTVGLFDPARDLIRTAAVWDMPDEELGAEMPRGVGLAGQVLATGQPILCRYGDLPSITLPQLADHDVLGLPIRWSGQLLGVFGLGAQPPKRFDASDLALLDLFARHAGNAIHAAQRWEAERRRTERFELIARIAHLIGAELDRDTVLQRAADAIHEVLRYENVDIPLIDPDDPETLLIYIRGGAYKRAITGVDRIPIQRGIMGAAARLGRTQLVNDVEQDPRYVRPPATTVAAHELAVPILWRGRTLGVLNVESERRFDALDQQSLEIVADSLAVAIQNAALFEQARGAVVLAERQKLARELHDSVTQVLAAISLNTQSLAAVWKRDPETAERRTGRVNELAQQAFAEMRALLEQLKPEGGISSGRRLASLELLERGGLGVALDSLLPQLVPEQLALSVNLARYEPQRLGHEQALLRIAQEAVSNAVRHARARQLEITLSVGRRYCTLKVADDGCGIHHSRRGGLGLKTMRSRITELGGAFRLRARPGGGTLLIARLPRTDRG